LQRRFAGVARVGPQDQTPQGQAHLAKGPHRRHHREDDRWQSFIGPGLIGLAETAAKPWAEKADEVTGHRAESFIPMGAPATCLLDDLLPRLHEGLYGPAAIGQGRSRAADSVCGQSPVGKRREDRAPTEQKPARDQCPQEPE
jgi:hypothetical protein